MQELLSKILCLPKDIQRLIVCYIIPRQNLELLEDIRDFTRSLFRLKITFLEITYQRLGNDIINYSQPEINDHLHYNIFHKLLVELMYTIPDNQYFFCNFIPLYMVNRNWILKYQKNTVNMIVESKIPNIENKIRFIFASMTPENRNKIVDYYYYREDIEDDNYYNYLEDYNYYYYGQHIEDEEEDYDW